MGTGSSMPKKVQEVPPEPVDAAKVQKVIAIARSGTFRNQKMAAESLHRMAKNVEAIQEQLVDEGGLIPLIELFSSKSPDVQEKCMHALFELCRAEKCRQVIYQCGGCTPMLDGLQSKFPAVRTAAVSAILSFCEHEDGQCKLVEEGAVPWLLRFLSDEAHAAPPPATAGASLKQSGEQLALDVLVKMSQNQRNLSRMVSDGAIEATFNAIHSSVKPAAARVAAMRVLARLCEPREGHQRVYHLNGNTGLQRIVALASTHDDDLKALAAAALAALARSNTLSQEMVAAGALPALKKLLRHKALPVAVAAAAALTALAKAPEYQRAIGEMGMIPHVVRLCRADSPEAELAVARLLLQLTQTEANLARIVAANGHRGLRRCADDPGASSDLRAAADGVLDKLAHLIEARRDATVQRAVQTFKRLSSAFTAHHSADAEALAAAAAAYEAERAVATALEL